MADEKNKKSEHDSIAQTNDPVNHPAHYTTGKIEVIYYIEDQKLPYHLGNAVKYISRAGKKDKRKKVEDLRKAVWYIERYIGMIGEMSLDTATVDSVDSTANAPNVSNVTDKKSSKSPTLSEAFINTEIFIDFESELIYGEDQAYICCPERFPTVRFQLMPTVGLIEIVDRLRHKLGFKPMYPIVGVDNGGCDDCYDCDDDCCYDFFISLNGFTNSHLDTCIAAVVADSDSVDNEDMYTIDLTEEEQKMLYKRFDEQCRRSINKTCEELLKEAEEMMD
ncbi:DUF3310 domain-containing protein [Candidatus Pseudoruminococcus sp.]|uniref:DUF3310 domain-containing protein n=1 Tax=Candidatus Pseudoruminococcus sp. TaxID=3101048 RepID=UPI00399ACE39